MFNKKVGQGQPSCFSRKARKRVWNSCENHSRFFCGAQKKGISAIVATVLIILITVAAVTIVWAAIIPMIKTNLEMGTACLEADVLIDSGSGYTCYDADKKILAVQIKKGPNEVDIAEVELLLGSGGTSSKMSMPFDLKSNAGKVFYLPVNEDVDEVSIAPVIKMGNSEKTCDITSKVKLKSCSLDSTSFRNELIMPTNISVASAGYDDSPREAFIKIEGETKVSTSRSYAIVILDSNWNYIESKKYDVYGSTSARDSMVSYLNGLAPGTIVIVSTYDEPFNNLAGVLEGALKSCGASSINLNQIVHRGSYILVGRKGAGEGNYYIEKVGPQSGNSIYYNS